MMSYEIDNKIAEAIHYPDCWDTMAYPTLASALWNLMAVEGTLCTTCHKIREYKG